MKGAKETDSVPPELKGYHSRSMLVAFLAMAVIFGCALVAINVDGNRPVLAKWMTVGFVTGIIFCVGWFICRAVFSTPKCPACRTRMVFTHHLSLFREARWRVFKCPSCGSQFRIPGLSFR